MNTIGEMVRYGMVLGLFFVFINWKYFLSFPWKQNNIRNTFWFFLRFFFQKKLTISHSISFSSTTLRICEGVKKGFVLYPRFPLEHQKKHIFFSKEKKKTYKKISWKILYGVRDAWGWGEFYHKISTFLFWIKTFSLYFVLFCYFSRSSHFLFHRTQKNKNSFSR